MDATFSQPSCWILVFFSAAFSMFLTAHCVLKPYIAACSFIIRMTTQDSLYVQVHVEKMVSGREKMQVRPPLKKRLKSMAVHVWTRPKCQLGFSSDDWFSSCSTRGRQEVAREDPAILSRRLPLRSLERAFRRMAPITEKLRLYRRTATAAECCMYKKNVEVNKYKEREGKNLKRKRDRRTVFRSDPLGISCMLNDSKDGCLLFYEVPWEKLKRGTRRHF